MPIRPMSGFSAYFTVIITVYLLTAMTYDVHFLCYDFNVKCLVLSFTCSFVYHEDNNSSNLRIVFYLKSLFWLKHTNTMLYDFSFREIFVETYHVLICNNTFEALFQWKLAESVIKLESTCWFQLLQWLSIVFLREHEIQFMYTSLSLFAQVMQPCYPFK